MNTTLIMPARNEAETIRAVVTEVRQHFAGTVIVVDNGSTDATPEFARQAGAMVVSEPVAGYGRALNSGIAAAPPMTDVFVFMDADCSDRPEDIPKLLAAIEAGADLALGRRAGAGVDSGSVAPAARFGNWLSGVLIGLAWGRKLHDLPPLKAIRAAALRSLELQQQTYGWTVEMLAKSARDGLEIVEVEVGYRHRGGGESKVSGNVQASVKAGYRIMRTIAAVAVSGVHRPSRGAVTGAALGSALLALLSAWLLTQGPASPRVLVTTWLLAWPLLLVTIGLGMAMERLLGRVVVPGRERRPTTPTNANANARRGH
jgi:hypothetical protein